MDKAPDFRLKEYKAVRREMDEAVKETRTLERYALVAVGAIWSWIVASRKHEYDVLMWLPALLVGFLAFRALVLTKHVTFIANHNRNREVVRSARSPRFRDTVQRQGDSRKA